MKRSARLPQKLVVLFFGYGLIYILIETAFHALFPGKDAGMAAIRTVFPSSASLVGYVSLWMFTVGAGCGIWMGLLNEWKWGRKHLNRFCLAIFGAVGVLGIEFSSGVVLNIWWKLNIWDYSYLPFNLMGQICVLFGFFWFLLAPLAFWVDDFIRWCIYDEITTCQNPLEILLDVLQFWKKPGFRTVL